MFFGLNQYNALGRFFTNPGKFVDNKIKNSKM